MVTAWAGSAIHRAFSKILNRSIKDLYSHLINVIEALRGIGAKFAVVGGVAVSFRTIERTTKDIDFVVAVESDSEAESTILALTQCGYRVETVLEHVAVGSLSTVRLISRDELELFVDVLFASSGIEGEVVSTARDAEVAPSVRAPVASIPALISLKVLSANPKTRMQDILDLQNLLQSSSKDDIDQARYLISLITERGFDRNKNLSEDLDRYIQTFLGAE